MKDNLLIIGSRGVFLKYNVIVVRGGGTRDNLGKTQSKDTRGGGGAKQNGQSGIVRGLVLGTMYA